MIPFTYRATDYVLCDHNGHRIRLATMVTRSDGRSVRFLDRIGKRTAIKQAKEFGFNRSLIS